MFKDDEATSRWVAEEGDAVDEDYGAGCVFGRARTGTGKAGRLTGLVFGGGGCSGCGR